MPLPVLDCDLFAGIGITIFAEMGTGIVLTDVLARYTSTQDPLPFVFVVFGSSEIERV